MINHLLSEEEGEEDSRDSISFRDSTVSRLTSVSRPSWSSPLAPITENYQTKKNSLKLTNIQVSIPNATTSKRRPGISPFTTYIIGVEASGANWSVRRRYSDFYYMHTLLKVYVTPAQLPKLPPKKYVGSSTSSAFVEERRLSLERYLKKLILEPSCWLRSDIVQFLDNPQHILMFTWNFERMQKMQELLGSMTVENKNQTEQLTQALETARSEVLVLKERIAEMEMLFLQQATGAAASKLNTAAMNTLSQGSNPRLSLLNEDDDEDEDEEGEGQESGGAVGGGDEATPLRTYAQALQEKLESDLSQTRTSSTSSSTDDDDFVLEREGDLSLQASDCPEISLTDSDRLNVQPNDVLEILKLAKVEDRSSNSENASDLVSSNSASNPYVLENDVTDPVKLQHRMVQISRSLQHAVMLSNELLEEKFTYATKHSPSRGKMLHVSEDDKAGGGDRDRESMLSLGSVASNAMSGETEGILSELLTFDDKPPQKQHDIKEDTDNDNTETDDSEVCVTFGDGALDYVSSKCQAGWSQRLAGRMDEILTVLIPSEDSIADRMNIAHFVKSMISRSIGGQLFPIGSFCSKTFLPRGDLDLCSYLTTVQSESWFVKVNEALCISSMTDNSGKDKDNHVNVRNVSFINSDVKVVKSIMNNIEVDISVNQITALYAQALLDKIDTFIGEKHVFKRSCILIKMWCEFESCRHTSNDVGGICDAKKGSSRLSTWAIMVMTIWVFNKYGKDIHTPFQALCGFLCYFSSFEWNKYALTVHGPVRVEDLGEVEAVGGDLWGYYALPKTGGFIPTDILDSMAARFLKVLESIYNIEKKGSVAKKPASNDPSQPGQEDEPESSTEVLPFSESQCEFDSIMGVQVHSHYRRGVVNIMDPIQPKRNLTHGMDTPSSRALMDALLGGKSSFVKLCFDSQTEMADAQEKLQGLKANSPDADPDTMALLSVRDIPLMRTFFENSTRHITELVGRGERGLPAGVEEQENTGYATLKSNQRELELAMKHAELILGNIVTPEALARLIVYSLEVKGPLPVGEVGKLLQEATGNEHLASALKTAFKGLKKVLEGFPGIFHIGSDHPFNPLVSLTEGYIEKRDSNVQDDSAVADLYVFSPSPTLDTRGATTAPTSSSAGGDSSGGEFTQLGKKGKASSFKGEGGARRDETLMSRSNSFGSDTNASNAGGANRKPPSARSPSNKKYNNSNKMDQQGGIRLSAQEYQQYQQYQMHMMHEQQRYQQFMQQQQQQHVQHAHTNDGSEQAASGQQGSSYMPPYPQQGPRGQLYIVPPPHGHVNSYGHGSPSNSPSTSSGPTFYDPNSVYYPSTNAMAGMMPMAGTSPTAGPGVAMLMHPKSNNAHQHNKNTKKKSPQNKDNAT